MRGGFPGSLRCHPEQRGLSPFRRGGATIPIAKTAHQGQSAIIAGAGVGDCKSYMETWDRLPACHLSLVILCCEWNSHHPPQNSNARRERLSGRRVHSHGWPVFTSHLSGSKRHLRRSTSRQSSSMPNHRYSTSRLSSSNSLRPYSMPLPERSSRSSLPATRLATACRNQPSPVPQHRPTSTMHDDS